MAEPLVLVSKVKVRARDSGQSAEEGESRRRKRPDRRRPCSLLEEKGMKNFDEKGVEGNSSTSRARPRKNRTHPAQRPQSSPRSPFSCPPLPSRTPPQSPPPSCRAPKPREVPAKLIQRGEEASWVLRSFSRRWSLQRRRQQRRSFLERWTMGPG